MIRMGTAILRPTHRPGRVCGHDLADHKPVKKHADRREVLFRRRRGVGLCHAFDVSGNVMRSNVRELMDAAFLAPGKT